MVLKSPVGWCAGVSFTTVLAGTAAAQKGNSVGEKVGNPTSVPALTYKYESSD